MTHSYFVTMIDYGKRGLEAIVDPEITRREVIARLQSREYKYVSFIQYVHDGVCEDVTDDMMDEAGLLEAV